MSTRGHTLERLRALALGGANSLADDLLGPNSAGQEVAVEMLIAAIRDSVRAGSGTDRAGHCPRYSRRLAALSVT